MKRPALTIAQLERINAVSAHNQERVTDRLRALATIATDAYAEARRAMQRCQACEYLNRYTLAGQAFTDWSCQLCKTPQPMHPNTSVPRLCSACAGAYGLCVTCGGDIEMQHRRRIIGRKAKHSTKAGA
jgi:hypothetical protein